MSLPISLRITDRRVVIVGGGAVALRKARTLLEAGARVTVVAPEIDGELSALLTERGGAHEARAYHSGDLDGAFLAVAATGDDAVNERVVRDAHDAHALILDATAAERGDLQMLATTRVGDIIFAVDSGGSTPAFAKRIAREIDERFGQSYARAARNLAHARTYVKALLPLGERAAVLRVLSDLPIEMLATMTPVDIEHEAESTIERLRTGDGEAPQTRTAICASRASKLAMTQTRVVAAKLAQRGVATTILNVTTTGDRVTDRPLNAIGSENVFVTELESALRDRRADYAVHSCKDLPSTVPSDMQLVAISSREDPRDAFCSERYASFEELPAGARVGTSSPRRRAQLQALRPDLRYDDVRGNVDTRLRKLRDGEYDAIVLAMAGLNRLRAGATHTVPFPVDRVVPAAAQGALAIEMRAEENDVANELRAAINDENAERCIVAERATLRALRAGCNAPIGVHARVDGNELRLDLAFAVFNGDDVRIERTRAGAPVGSLADAEALGLQVAQRMLALLPLAGRTVVLPRTQDRPSRIAGTLRDFGANVVELRAGEAPAQNRAPDLVIFPSSGSVAAAAAFLGTLGSRRPAVAAMGPQSAAAATEAGWAPDLIADEASLDALVGAVRAHLERKAP